MGKKIENYILQTVVGSGQFGKVYKAFNQKTNQTVAIKVIQIQKFRLSPKLQQFTINQINTLSKIQDSTHIVRFIEILKTANNYYFVYEFCNEGTLEQKIKSQGKFTEEKALGYFKQLLSAFKMLVKNNIMHRDIKPSNILLNNGIIKLADFGFCKPMKDSKDLAQTMLGSPIYMAPEILKGEIYTMKADIWSLGVVLYQMLYGFCPFQQRSIARLINLIDEGTVTFSSNVKISKNTEELLKRMLVKDQFKRIQWRELFEYNLNPTVEIVKAHNEESKYFNKTSSSKKQNITEGLNCNMINQPQISNPFSKKHFQSVNQDNQIQQRSYVNQQKNQMTNNRNNSSNRKYFQNERGVSEEKNRRRSNTVHDIRDVTNNPSVFNNTLIEKDKDSYSNYHTNNSDTNLNNFSATGNLTMKKARSTSLPDVQKKIIQNILENRQNILKGVKMIQKFLSQSSSKLSVCICCFIAKKVKQFAHQTQQTIKKSLRERQNRNKQNVQMTFGPSEVEKSINLIQEQILRINQKLIPFENQLLSIHEPQDIIFLRYGEEEHLTQQKDGLGQLLMIDDYLNISSNAKSQANIHTSGIMCNNYGLQNRYYLKSKKQLLEQYQKRILRKA